MNDQYNEPTSYLNSGIKVTETAIHYLNTIRKWTMFFSILGFIGIGLMILLGIFIGSLFAMIPGASAMPVNPASFSVIYFIFAVIHFFPVFYLFKFSTGLKRALEQRDELVLENALESLKSHYKYIGIFVSVILGIYALIFIIAMLAIALK